MGDLSCKPMAWSDCILFILPLNTPRGQVLFISYVPAILASGAAGMTFHKGKDKLSNKEDPKNANALPDSLYPKSKGGVHDSSLRMKLCRLHLFLC